MLLGIKLAHELGIRYLWTKFDSLVLVNTLNNVYSLPWSVSYVVNAIRGSFSLFDACRVTYIPREGNSTADAMANWGIVTRTSCLFFQLQDLPKSAKCTFNMDKQGIVGLRNFFDIRTSFAIFILYFSLCFLFTNFPQTVKKKQ